MSQMWNWQMAQCCFVRQRLSEWLAVRPAVHAMSLSNLIARQAVAHIQIKTNICYTILCHVGSLELQKAVFMLCKVNCAGNDVLRAYSCICQWASYHLNFCVWSVPCHFNLLCLCQQCGLLIIIIIIIISLLMNNVVLKTMLHLSAYMCD